MARVFVSFRNGDQPYAAALLFHALCQRFGAEAVFRSSDSIAPGSRWAEEIWSRHRQSEVVIVVVGPHWLSITDQRGKRLWQHDDWVRREVEEALRSGKHLLPVLLAGTGRFGPEDLPPSIAGLAEIQSISFDHRGVDASVGRVLAAVADLLEEVPAAGGEAPGGGAPAAGAAEWLRIWNIPARLPHAVARDTLLRALRADVVGAGGQRPVLLHGPVGAGKTQLAVEYAHRFAGDHHLAWWVPAQRPELLWTQLAALASAAGVEVGPDLPAALPRLAAELRRRGRWLLVIDGADDPAALAGPVTALAPGVDVIITSRRGDWGLLPAADRVVGGFTRAESLQVLRAGLPDPDGSQLERLAVALDDIPLAVAQAAAFLPRSALSTGAYVDLLATHGRQLLERGDTYVYPRSIAAAWSIGLADLRDTTPAASDLLELVCVGAPAPVPLDLLGIATAEPTGSAVLDDPITRADAFLAVARSGLVPLVSGRLHPHGLFQAFVLAELPPQRVTQVREMARRLLARIPRPDPREPDAWDRYALLLPHVLALDLADSRAPGCQELMLDTVHHLVVRGDPATARDLAVAVVDRWRQRHGPASPATLDAMVRLAQAHFRLRDYAAALAVDEQVLAGRRRTAGEDDPQTLAAAHDVAMARFARDGDPATVRTGLAEVLARRRRVLGEDHPETLRSAHNLALVMRAGGEREAAWRLMSRVHPELVRALGPDHPDTLRAGHALALDLRTRADREGARRVEADCHQRRRRVLGPQHPDTLRSGYCLAGDLLATGSIAPARALADEVHERCRRTLGEAHLETMRAAYLLAKVLFAAGETVVGQRLAAEAAAGLRALAATPARS